MSAAFRRAKAKPVAATTATGSTSSAPSSDKSTSPVGFQLLRGVKPWAGGVHLTSTGLQELDVILGGGQPLGTCICIQQDRWTTDLANSFVKYWCAEVCEFVLEGRWSGHHNRYVTTTYHLSSFLTLVVLCRHRPFHMNSA